MLVAVLISANNFWKEERTVPSIDTSVTDSVTINLNRGHIGDNINSGGLPLQRGCPLPKGSKWYRETNYLGPRKY